jgi:two-component system LytT family response regulator
MMQLVQIQYRETGGARIIQHPAAVHFAARSEQSQKIELVTHAAIRYERVGDIAYCKADGNYCHVMRSNGERIVLSKTLKWVEGNLPEQKFIRVHASYLVQIDQITRLGSDKVTLIAGTEIPVSRSKRSALRKRLTACNDACLE